MAKKSFKKTEVSVSNRPIGVTILAILGFIGVFLISLLGISLIVASTAIANLIGKYIPEVADFVSLGAAVLVVLGIFLIALAVLDYFINKGLLDGKNWARIVILVLCGISFISNLLNFEIISGIINGLIIWYLGFYKPVINYFR